MNSICGINENVPYTEFALGAIIDLVIPNPTQCVSHSNWLLFVWASYYYLSLDHFLNTSFYVRICAIS